MLFLLTIWIEYWFPIHDPIENIYIFFVLRGTLKQFISFNNVIDYSQFYENQRAIN